MRVYSNTAAAATLSAAIDNLVTSIGLTDVTGWPVPAANQDATAQIGAEVVSYTGITAGVAPAGTLTGVVRGADGTTAASHASGAAAKHVLSGKDIEARLPWESIFPELLSGKYYGNRGGVTGSGTVVASDTTILFSGFVVPHRSTTFDSVEINVATAVAATSVRLGLYDSGPQGRPRNRLQDFGTVATDTTGTKVLAISPVLTLPPGLYHLAVIGVGGGPTLRAYGNMSGFGNIPDSTASTTMYTTWRRLSAASGILEDPIAPANLSEAYVCPRLLMRAQ